MLEMVASSIDLVCIVLVCVCVCLWTTVQLVLILSASSSNGNVRRNEENVSVLHKRRLNIDSFRTASLWDLNRSLLRGDALASVLPLVLRPSLLKRLPMCVETPGLIVSISVFQFLLFPLLPLLTQRRMLRF